MKQSSVGRNSAYVVCIDDADYPASLEKHKIYRVIDDDAAADKGDIRIIDESGADYLYPAERFVAIALPAAVERSFAVS